jgi:Bardet-Biedl syndrome 5 protein
LFSTVQSLYNAFDTSRLFRDIKLRGGIMRDNALIMLPGERIISTTNGVWNLSGDQGNLGTLVNTNVRAVWFANLTENFNASVPFMQIKSVSKKLSKFGNALVMDTTARSGSFTLGFRLDPPEKLDLVLKVNPFSGATGVTYVASRHVFSHRSSLRSSQPHAIDQISE